MSDIDEKISLKELGLEILQIPDELKQSMMWAGSTYKILDPKTGRRDKAPRNIYTGDRISVTSPEGWVTFEEAVNSGYPAIGMRLTKDDPYTVIDIDKSENQDDTAFARKVFSSFDSYSELSKSEKGVHIILKASSEQGRRNRNIEIYSQERYIICTGKVLNGRFDIEEGGKTLEDLKATLRPFDNPDALPIMNSQEEIENDDSILKRMFSAENGEKIEELFRTKPKPGDDWSQLDAQLAQHIAFYTKNHNQALRLFRKSALYRGDGSKVGYERVTKYEEDYLLRRTFARAWYLEYEREKEKLRLSEKELQEILEKQKITPQALSRSPIENPNEQLCPDNYDDFLKAKTLPPMTFPKGLLGDITNYIYTSAPRPVLEVAIAGGLSLLSGIAGRHYNINGSGLGLYIVLLAKTGRGKEAASTGVSALLDLVSLNLPAAAMFRGPSQIASGQGLIRMLSDTNDDMNIPSKFCILSEFGHTMKIITSKDANAADLRTRQAMLDLFSKNSWGSTVKETAYADKSNNTAVIRSPNLCLLGDTTPDMFFGSVDLSIVKEGFLPRFMLIEYAGPRTKANYNANRIPSDELVTRLTTLIAQVLAMRDSNNCININYKDDDAFKIMSGFDEFCDSRINDDEDDSELWNRAHLKALRLAGILAISDNMFEPKITVENANMAIEYILRDMLSYSIRFESGAFGASDMERENELLDMIFNYFEGNLDFEKEGVPREYLDYGVIPLTLFYKKFEQAPVFSNTKKPSRIEIDNSINYLVKQGYLRLLDLREVRRQDRKLFFKDELSYCMGSMYGISMKQRGYNPKNVTEIDMDFNKNNKENKK